MFYIFPSTPITVEGDKTNRLWKILRQLFKERLCLISTPTRSEVLYYLICKKLYNCENCRINKNVLAE